jgi:hypothetical protein
MKKLIEAFTIFSKYSDAEYPLNCSHDLLYVDVDPKKVSEDDIKRLKELGFKDGAGEDLEGGFVSYRYGSC